jgi:hypothetical protein
MFYGMYNAIGMQAFTAIEAGRRFMTVGKAGLFCFLH